jgi:hypothetical protein
MFFEGDYIIDEKTGLPRLEMEIPLENTDVKYKVDALNYSTVPMDMLPTLQKQVNLPQNLDINLLDENLRQEHKIKIDILPFIRYSENEFRRLESFSIVPVLSSTKLYASNSVLSDETWYKFKIKEDGIYKITYNELINLGFSDPENIRIYGNGGTMLPFHNSESHPDDLKENAIYVEKGSDGIFNENDYILFYGKGPVKWIWDEETQTMSHELNVYSDAAYYFITTSFGPGKRIETINSSNKSPNFFVNSFNAYVYHEKNLENLIHSGRVWYGESLHENDFTENFSFQNICSDSTIHLKTELAGRAGSSREVTVSVNNHDIVEKLTGVDMSLSYVLYAQSADISYDFTSQTDNINFSVSYAKKSLEDKAYLDYVSLNGWRKLIYDNSIMKFFNSSSVGENNVSKFTLKNAGSNLKIWEISDLYNIKEIQTSITGTELSFTLNTDSLRTFIAFDKQNTALFKSPVFTDESGELGIIGNQNLHAIQTPDLLIVTHPAFINQANELAQLHRDAEHMKVYVATTTQVYNEFSSGGRDVSAIRNFAKMLYDRSKNESNQFKYLLLFGDGSFDNLTDVEGNTNYIPTYQSLNSLHPTRSYGTDDYYGLLEDDEGGYSRVTNDDINGDLDIGVGRIPVISDGNEELQAQGVIDKIKSYYYEQDEGDWRNSLCFVGDDGEPTDASTHMNHANEMANLVLKLQPGFDIKKIMLDAYEQVTTVSGPSYPEVSREIKKSFEKGILVFNYNGHGGPNGITAEKVLQKGDIEKLRNIKKLPLFITATCQVSRYDDVEIDDAGNYAPKTSAGEAVLLNSEGGGIALYTTTRVVYSNPNFELNQNIYNYLFKKDQNDRKYTLGDAFRLAKNDTDGNNKLNFALIGDPAITLSYPEFQVITDSINNKPFDEALDTLKAFSKVSVSGHLAYDDSIMMGNFNGYIYPKVLDKKVIVTTLGNDGFDPFVFETQNNALFKGKATVVNGRFNFSFVVPKDISYDLGNGKIIYYARNDQTDAHGFTSEFYIGGTDTDADIDETGPEIKLYLNDTNFVDGDFSNESPYIYAHLFDENGINTTGIGIGHDLVAVLDDDFTNPFIMNDYFEGAADNYQAGVVNYQLFDLEPGKHTLTLKAWDTYNNSSEESITFYVAQSDQLVLGDVRNYPNPTNGYTYFQYHHNWPETEHQVTIDIYNLTGGIVKTLKATNYESGYVSVPIEWNGKADNGALPGNGVYPYRVTVKTEEGLISTLHSKLVIFR